jgi:hypothetical protein
MGVAALAASFGVSGLASAVTIYGTDGFITDSTCGALSSTLAVGAEQVGQLYLQPAGIAGSSTESAATVSTLNGGTPVPGSTVTYSCVTNNGAPAKLNGNTMTFVCYKDTQSGPGSAAYVLTQKFKVTATNNKAANTVETVNTLLAGITPICHWTTDGTYITQ